MHEQHKSLTEQYDELALSLLMDTYAEAEGERLLQEFEAAEKTEFPKALDKRCRQAIDSTLPRKAGKWIKSRPLSIAVKAAVTVLVLLVVASVTIVSVEAFRVPVFNFIIHDGGKYGIVDFISPSNEVEPEVENVIKKFELYIPPGYELYQRDLMKPMGGVRYKDENRHYIHFEYASVDSSLSVDTEGAPFEEVEFCGYPAVLQKKDGYCLMWLDEETRMIYILRADDLSFEAFWQLACSIVS